MLRLEGQGLEKRRLSSWYCLLVDSGQVLEENKPRKDQGGKVRDGVCLSSKAQVQQLIENITQSRDKSLHRKKEGEERCKA